MQKKTQKCWVIDVHRKFEQKCAYLCNYIVSNRRFYRIFSCSAISVKDQSKNLSNLHNVNQGFLNYVHTSTFIMYFKFLNLYFGNQIWKSMRRYFGKFCSNFQKFDLFLYFGFSFISKLYF